MRPQSFYENKRHHEPEDHREGSVRECRDCLELFSIDDRQARWYAQRDMHLPRRCPECRRRGASRPRASDYRANASL